MKKHTGYRLHWEGQDATPEAYATMAQVRAAIREGAKEGEITVKEATRRAYVVSEKEYQESLAQR